jgi:hypothetical protein
MYRMLRMNTMSEIEILQDTYDKFVSGKYSKFGFYPQDIQDAKKAEMAEMFASTVNDIPKRKLLRVELDAKYVDLDIESKIIPFVEVDGVKIFVDDIPSYIKSFDDIEEPPMLLHIVRGLRAREYSKLNQDELRYDDMVNGTNTWGEAIEAIKVKYPKPL